MNIRTPAALVFLFLLPVLAASCTSRKPPDELFHDNLQKMVMLDRAMGFKEEVEGISILERTRFPDQVEVKIRVEGWATHRDLAIGATLPVSTERKRGWSIWKFFCRKEGDDWVIVDKYKVDEGFNESS